MHPSIIDTTDFDNRWTLFDLLHRALLSRLMVGIKRPVSFYALDFNGIVTSGALVVLAIRVVDGASLAGYSHDLRLVSRTFEIRIGILQLCFLTSLVFGILVYFEMRWGAPIARVEFFFLIAS